MSRKKAFALRVSEPVLAAMQAWADDELRSLNAQIEYVLRQALVQQGRLKITRPARIELPEDEAPEEE